ncbi:CBO0543 family protein [Cytobacillus oceanisediminis]|uniref:CBO0543 family protein n=1 Tax=Cytobacillus oceanisediminis TaxID=665099 RepID=UPI003734FB36
MFEQVEERRIQLMQIEMEYWLQDVFSAHWWFLLLINLFFLILLIILIDKQRVFLMTITFLISFIIIGIVNEIGNYFGFWSYPHQFLGFLQSFNAVDFLTVPVIMTLIYQTFSKWKYYLFASIIIFAIIGFIVIPTLVYFNFYNSVNWNNFYSFLTLLLTGCLIKLIIDFFKSRA